MPAMKDAMLNTIRKIRDKDYQVVKTLSPSKAVEYYQNKAASFDDLIRKLSRQQKKQGTQV